MHVCRWCGEGYENNEYERDPAGVAAAHRFCLSALALQPDVDSLEDMLLVAEHRELSRPTVLG